LNSIKIYIKNLCEYIIDLIIHLFPISDNTLLNEIKKLLLGINAELIFATEGKSWVIKMVVKYLTKNLNEQELIKAEISNPRHFKKKIIHFGSINCLLNNKGLTKVKTPNKTVLTWFHITPTDIRLKFVPILNKIIDIVHTSSPITKKKLIELGFDNNKIVVIPLGVDLYHFKKINEEKKRYLKKKFNIPENKIIIGSFQKDGVGWGAGLEPKLIKGPDIFCEVAKSLNEACDIHVFLTGPARGYIKKQLEGYNIPYTHIFLDNYLDLVECYNILDLYLVTSRAEGGPLSILEAMATGVPLVTTNVGMVPIVVKHGLNGFVTEINDANQLYQYSTEIIKNKELREKIIANGLKTVQNYSWKVIAKEYYEKIYKRLLDY